MAFKSSAANVGLVAGLGISLLAIFIGARLEAAPKSYYPEVEWRTVETEHFTIHYHDNVEWTATRVRDAAEGVYKEVTERYDFKPHGKVHIVVRDLEDTANGFAVWHLNWITLWATHSQYPLRGHHDWVRGTLLHEFSHVVSLQASAAFGQRIEGLRFGGLEESWTKNHFDLGASLFLTSNPAPRWWAEAIAQWDSDAAGLDSWDSLQQMLLRSAANENNLLTLDELHNIRVRENFGQEMVYNQGFNFVSYLHQACGQDLNRRIAQEQRRRKRLDFAQSIAAVCQKPLRELDRDWRHQLEESSREQLKGLGGPEVSGAGVAFSADEQPTDPPGYEGGLWNFSPQFSPNGHFFSFATNNRIVVHYLTEPFDLSALQELPSPKLKNDEQRETNDPGVHGFYHQESGALEGGQAATVEQNRNSSSWSLTLKGRYFSWAPDSQKLIIARKLHRLDGGYQYYQLQQVDLQGCPKKQPQFTPLAASARATTPAWSPDGKLLAFGKNQDGTTTLMIAPIISSGGDHTLQPPTHTLNHELGSQSLEPTWFADGKRLIYTLTPLGASKSALWLYDLASRKSLQVTPNDGDYRQPFVDSPGELWFSSDRSGIFQIYRLNLASRQMTQVTRVSTGAFHPYYLTGSGRLLYSRFSSFGFKPYHFNSVPALATITLPAAPVVSLGVGPTDPGATPKTIAGSHPYEFDLRPVRLFPTVIFEDRFLKAGMSLQLSDYLEKHNFLVAAVLGRDQDYYFSYLNRQRPVEFFFNYSRFVRASGDALLVNDGDSLADEPPTLLGYDIDFVSTGLQKSFYPEKFLFGDHQLALSYNLRRVEQDFGVPILLDSSDPTSAATSVNLITNHEASLEWRYRYFADEYHPQLDVNPRDGREWRLAYAHVFSDTFPASEYDFNRFLATYTEYWAIPGTSAQTLELRFNGGYIDEDVNPIDEFFAGGRLNFRAFGDISANSNFSGYEAFSIRGETLLVGSATYRFPLMRRIAKKTGVIYWDSLFGALFVEAGNAWSHNETQNCRQNASGVNDCAAGNTLLEDIGAEIRLKAFLFNDFNPWNSVLRVAYGLQDSADYGFRDDDLPLRTFLGIGTNF